MKAPPVTSRDWPEMKEAKGDASSSIAPAASAGVPMRFIGMVSSAAISANESPPGMPSGTFSPATTMFWPASLFYMYNLRSAIPMHVSCLVSNARESLKLGAHPCQSCGNEPIRYGIAPDVEWAPFLGNLRTTALISDPVQSCMLLSPDHKRRRLTVLVKPSTPALAVA